MTSRTFPYFAFASNLLRERLTVNNPSAVFTAVGKLQNYQLVFCDDYPGWYGGGANIEEKKGSEVWGVVWTMDAADQASLDRQESAYTRTDVKITTLAETVLQCRTYQLQGNYDITLPSRHYKDVIVRGAKQNCLPQDYVARLEEIQCNDFDGKIPAYDEILKRIQQ